MQIEAGDQSQRGAESGQLRQGEIDEDDTTCDNVKSQPGMHTDRPGRRQLGSLHAR